MDNSWNEKKDLKNLGEQPVSNLRGLQEQSTEEESYGDENKMPNSNENSGPRAGTSRSFETPLAGQEEVSAGGGFEANSPPESAPPPQQEQEQERPHSSTNAMNRLMQPEGGNYHQRLALMPTLRSVFLPGLDLATQPSINDLFHYFIRYGELKRVTVLSNTDETSFAIVTSMRRALAANPRHFGGSSDDRSRSWLNTWNDRPMLRQGRVTRHFYNRHQAGNAAGLMRMSGHPSMSMGGNILISHAGSGMPMVGNGIRSGRVLPLAVMRSSPLATGGSIGAVTGVQRWRRTTHSNIGSNSARSIALIMSNATADATSPMGENSASVALSSNTDVVPVPPSGENTATSAGENSDPVPLPPLSGNTTSDDKPSTSTGVVSSSDVNIINTRSMTRLKAAASQPPVRRSERLSTKMLSAKPPSKAAPARAPKRPQPTSSKRPAKRARVAKKPEAKKPETKKRRQRKPTKKGAAQKPKRKAVARKQDRKESNKPIPVERLPQWTINPGRSSLPAAVEKEVCDVGSGGSNRRLTAPRTVRQGLSQAAKDNQFSPPESTAKKTRAKNTVEKKKAAAKGRNKKTKALRKKIVKKQEAVRQRTRSKSKARKRPVKGRKAAQVESHENPMAGSSQAGAVQGVGSSLKSLPGKSGHRASSCRIVTRAKSGSKPGPQSTFESVGSQGAAPQAIANPAGASGSTPALTNSGETPIKTSTIENVASQAAPLAAIANPENIIPPAAPLAISSKPDASISSLNNVSSQASPQFLSNSTIHIPQLSSVMAAESSGSIPALSLSIGDIIPYISQPPPPPELDSPASPPPELDSPASPPPDPRALLNPLPPVVVAPAGSASNQALQTIPSRGMVLHTPLDTLRAWQNSLAMGKSCGDQSPDSPPSSSSSRALQTGTLTEPSQPKTYPGLVNYSSSSGSSRSSSPPSPSTAKKPFAVTSDEEMKRLPCFINPWPHMKAKPAGFYLETLPPDSAPTSSSQASKKSPPKRLGQPPAKPLAKPPVRHTAKPPTQPTTKPLGRVNDPRLARGSLSNPPKNSIYSPKPPLPQTNSTNTPKPKPVSARERVFQMPYPRAPLARIMHIDPPNRFQQPPPTSAPTTSRKRQPAKPKRDFKLNCYTNEKKD